MDGLRFGWITLLKGMVKNYILTKYNNKSLHSKNKSFETVENTRCDVVDTEIVITFK